MPEHRAQIAEFAHVVQHRGTHRPTENQECEACEGVDIAILGRSGGGLSVASVDALGGRMRAIGVVGGGVKAVSPERVLERGIVLFNSGFAMANSVAEFTLALMLCGLRDIPHMIATMREDGWGKARSPVDLGGREVGLLGFGAIGQRVADLLRPFSTTIRVYDPYCSDRRILECGVQPSSLEDLLATSDVVSIHAGRTRR
ncbi:MAG: hypothetical protein CME26_17245 [Gemmatimonadetes bacterium]|nr:hypothetical protein [Gemmatimonadota bacterium]